MEQKKSFRSISPSLLVLLSFLTIILVGSFLLTIPFAHQNGQWGNYMDSLVAATSATCVTGLCSYSGGIGNELTLFGQIVMLIMIEIGGLGFITVLTFFITLFTGKLQFKDRFYISQAVGSTSVADVVRFVRKILLITGIVQIIGFLLGLPVFLTVYSNDIGRGIWNSIFTSVSAFNNAGFDLFGGDSLVRIASNPIVYNMPTWCYYYLCSYIMILIILGGLSFITIMDVFAFKKAKNWRAFTKITLTMTAILLIAGFAIFMITDGIKPTNTMNPFDALFQSVTLRTAGYATYNQADLSIGGQVTSCFLMFIGGNPLSTAGGVKTTTLFIIVLAIYSYFRGKQVTAFKRRFSTQTIIKAMSLIFVSILFLCICYVLMWSFEANNSAATANSMIYELFSAFGTVGVTQGLTPTLTVGSKIIICVLMFLGRLGPMTMFNIFQKNMNKESDRHFEYVEEDILIG